MITLSAPINFTEAMQSRDVRSLLPTTLSSAELRDALPAEFMERAVFSARVSNAQFLQEIDDVVRKYVAGEMDLATAKAQLAEFLRRTGYIAKLGEAGTIKDLSSDARIDLIVRTNAGMAQGYGQFIQGQTPGALDLFPCSELFRLRARKKERAWNQRWEAVGGVVHDGRMIARKDDDIWMRLGNSFDDSLGNPYPPFAFNSGMWVKPVHRKVAMQYGIIGEWDQVTPQTRGFNQDLKFPLDLRSKALETALMETLGDDYELNDGVRDDQSRRHGSLRWVRGARAEIRQGFARPGAPGDG